MWFGLVDPQHAAGCILAHSIQLDKRRVKKGSRLDKSLIAEFVESGVTQITVARLDDTDLHENDAALQIAVSLSGEGIRLDKASTGRVNLFARHDGLLCFDRQAIIAINSIDESITVATLPENTWVLSGKMVATCKIITYGVERATVDHVVKEVGNGVVVKPVVNHKAVLLQTCLPTVKESVLDKTGTVISQRLNSRHATLIAEQRCDHTVESLAAVLAETHSQVCDWILIAGASAISDRADVIPAALEAAGGKVIRYGLPVDPGNLLLLGELHGRVVLGLPGCARSPKLNGLDLLLDRLACGVDISQAWLNSLAVGGLLTEALDRPQPRVRAVEKTSLNIAGLVLAAGASRRAGMINKLMVNVGDVPMVRHVVNSVCNSNVGEVVVVTGHQHEKISDALKHTAANVVFCATHDQGMAHSLSYGISRLQEVDAVLVCLADMPDITVELINTIIGWKDAETLFERILVPTFNGKRGNPVLVGRAFFDTLLQHIGDTGARFLMKQYPERVIEVPVEEESILLDYDTPQALAELNNNES